MQNASSGAGNASDSEEENAKVSASGAGPTMERAEPFVWGSLSYHVGHHTFGYNALGEWPEVQPDTEVREPKKDQDAGRSSSRRTGYGSDSSGSSSSSEDSSDVSTDMSSDSDSDSDGSDDSDDGDKSSSDSSSSSSSSSMSSASSDMSSDDDDDDDDDGSDGTDKANATSNRRLSNEDLIDLWDADGGAGGASAASASARSASGDAEGNGAPAAPAAPSVAMVPPVPSFITHELLTSAVCITYQFSRQPSQFGAAYHLINVSLCNTSDEPIGSVQVSGFKGEDDQALEAFEEVKDLQPGLSGGVFVQLHADFGASCSPLSFSISVNGEENPCALPLPVGERAPPERQHR